MLFVFITIVIESTGIGIIIPTLPDLIADVANVTLEGAKHYIGPITAAYSIMQFIFSPVVGGLSDRYGRRPILLMSLFGLGVDYVFMFFAPSLLWLVIGRCISGMFGASYSTAMAYIADISTSETKTKNFGMVGAAFGVGFIIGPAIGGFLGDYGTRAPFIAAAVLSLVNFAYGYFVLKESLPVEKRRKFSWERSNPVGAIIQMKKYRSLALLFVVLFLYYFAGEAIHTTWVFLTEEKFNWSKKEIGASLAIVGICMAIVQGGLAGVFAKKLGNVKTALFGLMIYIVSCVGIGMASSGWMLYALMLPYAFTGLAGPTIQSIMSNSTNDAEQGELQGTISSVVSLAAVPGILIMPEVLAATTNGLPEAEKIYGTPYFLAAFSIGLALLVFLRAVKKG